jgi:2-haloacid dehalogenase
MDRRAFLASTAAGAFAGTWPRSHAPRFRAVAFDAFPILDPRPVFAACERLFPERGGALANTWRTRLFEYQWIRSLGGAYADFEQVMRDSLVFAARELRLELGAAQRDALLATWLELRAWPDAAESLRTLREEGVRVAFLSNMTTRLLETGIRNSGLEREIELVISTDRIRTFKPAGRAYQLGVDALGLRREEICFAAYAGWDAVGATWFGYPTFWVNRAGATAEELGVEPAGQGRDLRDLVRFVLADA